jgi:site-specific DNA-methyltransferase (adenine-specific)
MNTQTIPSVEMRNWMNELLTRADGANDIATKVDNEGKYIRTPWELCAEIIAQIKQSANDLSNAKVLVVDTVEFIPVLLAFGVNKCNITYVAPYEFKGKIAASLGAHVMQEQLLTWSANMKFDVVVGNPPYQDGRDKLFYQKFVNRAYELSSDVVAMITPAGWTSIADLKTSFCKNIINSGLITCKYLKDSAFANVQVMTVYFVSSKKTECADVTLSTYKDSIAVPRNNIVYFPTETVAGISIIEKVKKSKVAGLTSLSGQLKRNNADVVPFSNFKCIFTAGYTNSDFDWAYVSSATGLANVGHHKVIVTHQTAREKLGSLKYAGPEFGVGMACHSFVVSDRAEADNLIGFLESKIIRFIVKTLKGAVASNSHTLFSHFPNLGFNKTWTDAELYAHFNLTQEEIDYIEATVK